MRRRQHHDLNMARLILGELLIETEGMQRAAVPVRGRRNSVVDDLPLRRVAFNSLLAQGQPASGTLVRHD